MTTTYTTTETVTIGQIAQLYLDCAEAGDTDTMQLCEAVLCFAPDARHTRNTARVGDRDGLDKLVGYIVDAEAARD